MATIADRLDDEEEQTRYIRRLRLESERIEAEARKLNAEAFKLSAEQQKLSAEERKLTRDWKFSPWLIMLQGFVAAAAMLGAGVAFAKLFLIP